MNISACRLSRIASLALPLVVLAAMACGSSGGSQPDTDERPGFRTVERDPTATPFPTPTATPIPSPTAVPTPTVEVKVEPTKSFEERVADLATRVMEEGYEFKREVRKDEVWGTILVGVGDEVLGTATGGFANQETGTEHSPDAVWPLLGMTDLFTVVGILQLHEQAKLDIDAPLSDIIDGFPNGDILSLHHLMTRTSGMTELLDWQVEPKGEPSALAKAFEIVKTKNPGLEPGKKYGWSGSSEQPSDTDYIVLRYLLEQVSGQTFEEYVTQNIFEPGGMETAFFAPPKEIEHLSVGYRATNWARSGGTRVVSELSIEDPEDLLSPIDDGKLVWGTTTDVFNWYRALVNGEYIGEEMLDKMFKPVIDLSNSYGVNSIHTAYGWTVLSNSVRNTAWSYSAAAGFGAEIYVDRQEDVVVVLFINRDNYSVSRNALFTSQIAFEVGREKNAQ